MYWYSRLNDERKDSIKARYLQYQLWVTALVKCDEIHFASSSDDSKIIIWKYDDITDNIKKESTIKCLRVPQKRQS